MTDQTGETLFGDDGVVPYYSLVDVHKPGARCSYCRKLLAGNYTHCRGRSWGTDDGRVATLAMCDECNARDMGGAS